MASAANCWKNRDRSKEPGNEIGPADRIDSRLVVLCETRVGHYRLSHFPEEPRAASLSRGAADSGRGRGPGDYRRHPRVVLAVSSARFFLSRTRCACQQFRRASYSAVRTLARQANLED